MASFLSLATIWSYTLWLWMFIIATYFVIYYVVYQRQTKRWERSNIPFLQPVFLIGHKNFSSVAKHALTLPIDQIYREYKENDILGFFLGTMPLILLKDHKLIRKVFSKNFNQVGSIIVLPESELEAQYMTNLTTTEERWKFTRTIMMPVYSLNWFQGPRFKGITEAIHEMWHIAEKSDLTGSPINVKEITRNATIHIGSLYLGINSHSKELKNGVRTIIEDFFETSYRRLLIFYSISVLPSLQTFEHFKFVSRKNCNTMSGILKHLITQRDQINIDTGDIIDIIRSLRSKQESKNSCRKDGDLLLPNSKGVISEEMTGTGLSFILAGSGSVSQLLEFAIHALSLYPEYQCKIRREVHESLEKHGVSEFNFEVTRNLSFTFHCLFETIRLYPPGPLLMRKCLEDFQIPGTNYIFRKGDKVAIPLYSVARDETHFKDPDSFNPDRFNTIDTSLSTPETLLSFGTGPRKCPGIKHGLIIGAAVIASLVYKYEIKPRSHLKLMDATDFNPRGAQISPKRDILVNLVRRENLGDA